MKMTNWFSKAGALAVLALSLALPASVHGVGVQDSAPDFTLKSLEGSNLRLEEYRGQVVLLNFWASWCPPCIYEMPELTRLKQQMADRPFEIIAINVGEKKYKVMKFVNLVNFELQVLLDTSNKTFNDWDVRTLPTSFLVGADGTVRHKIRGNPGWEQQETISLIEQLIAETATSATLSN